MHTVERDHYNSLTFQIKNASISRWSPKIHHKSYWHGNQLGSGNRTVKYYVKEMQVMALLGSYEGGLFYIHIHTYKLYFPIPIETFQNKFKTEMLSYILVSIGFYPVKNELFRSSNCFLVLTNIKWYLKLVTETIYHHIIFCHQKYQKEHFV